MNFGFVVETLGQLLTLGVFSILTLYLSPNIIYFIRSRVGKGPYGKRPNSKPSSIWIIWSLSLFGGSVLLAVANPAPNRLDATSSDLNVQSTMPSPIQTTKLPTAEATLGITPPPVVLPSHPGAEFIDGFYQSINNSNLETAWLMETDEFQQSSTQDGGYNYFYDFWTTFKPAYELFSCTQEPNKIAIHLRHFYRYDTYYWWPRPIEYWFEYTVTVFDGKC